MGVPSSGAVVNVNRGAASIEGGIYLGGDVWFFAFNAAMVNGTSGTGAGVTGPGSICGNSSVKKAYTNTGTKASPTWTVVGTQT